MEEGASRGNERARKDGQMQEKRKQISPQRESEKLKGMKQQEETDGVHLHP